MTGELGIDPVPIDVGRLVQRSVASLYSYLVTRPTGRAVRLAIESQISDVGRTSLSLIDLSEVTVLDFSCADEVVAKLLLRYLEADRPRDAFFVFRGVRGSHRDPIEAVLERQALAAVAEVVPGRFALLGERTEREGRMWELVERRGSLRTEQVEEVVPDGDDRAALARLVERRLVFRTPERGPYHALSTLIGDLR